MRFLNKRKKSFLTIAAILSGSITASPLTATPLTHALVQVDDLCVLSQQILKDYAIVGMGIESGTAANRLKNAIAAFEKEIKEVEHSAIGKELIEEVRLFDQHWQAIKPELEKKPNKKAAAELYRKVSELVAECEKVAHDIEKKAHKEGAKEVAALSEMAVESQRLAAIYMFKSWHIDGFAFDKDAKKTFEEAEVIYQELMQSDALTAPLKEKLKVAEKHLMLFKLMILRKAKTSVPALINRKADELLQEIREIMEFEMKAYDITEARE